MRRRVERLGSVEGQDVILLLPTLQPVLGQEYRGSRRGARHGPELPVRSHPLAQKEHRALNLHMRRAMSIRMSYCPSAMDLYSFTFPVAVPLGISQIMASCQDSGTSCTRAPGALAPAQAALL